MQVGIVKEIWRYPVKSMRGESLTHSHMSATGLYGDRGWALRDDAEVVGARHFPALIQNAARYLEEPTAERIPDAEITFMDGTRIKASDPAAGEKISGIIGTKLWLNPIPPPSQRDYYRRRPRDQEQMMAYLWQQFGREPGEPMPDMNQFPPELMELSSFPGTHFDATPLHILTTAALAHLRGKNPGADWDVQRFRPNIFIETASGMTGVVENGWTGRKLRIGAATIACLGQTPRCSMPTQRQGALRKDPSVLRTIVREANQNLGIYAAPAAPGAIQVGDTVELL